MLKIAKTFLIIFLIFILVVAFFRNALCRFLINTATVKATGLRLTIKDLNLDILGSSLYIGGITLLNPPGFENEVLGKAKEIFIKYDLLGSLRKLRLRQVKLDLSEINIVRNKEGSSNVAAFKRKRKRERGKPVAGPKEGALPLSGVEAKAERSRRTYPKFLIDRLEVSLGKVTYTDYRAGVGEPAIIIFTVKSPCVFKNVSDLGSVVDSVSTKGGFKSILDNLLGMIPQDAIKNATEAVKQRIKKVWPNLPKIDLKRWQPD